MIKNRLKDILYKKNIKQNWLSEQTGLPTSTISNIVNNKAEPYVSAIYKIAKALNITMDDLIYDDEEQLSIPVEEGFVDAFENISDFKMVNIEMLLQTPSNFGITDVLPLLKLPKGIEIAQINLKNIKD